MGLVLEGQAGAVFKRTRRGAPQVTLAASVLLDTTNMGCLTASSWVTLTLLVVIIIALQTDPCVAKRGCSAFGHSCFGGHGKRSEGEALTQADVEQELTLQQDEIPAASQLQSRMSLSPFLRQWLQSYQRSTGELDEK